MLALVGALLAGPAAAYTWAPRGQFYAQGKETVSTPGTAPATCEAFWYLEVTEGQLRVLSPGAPLCAVRAFGLPWRVPITGPARAIVRQAWFEGTALTFCQGNLTLRVEPNGVLTMINDAMAPGCAMSVTITPNRPLHIAP